MTDIASAGRPRLQPDEYQILVEQAPILIWRSNVTAACDYFNERWLEFTGRTMEQEVGNGWAEGVHPEDFDRGVPFYREGEFAGFIGSCIDVEEKVQARIALAEAHEREVKMLHGLLPICAHCRRIRDERGQWHQLEAYVRDHSEAEFSHGICPDCAAELYPDEYTADKREVTARGT